MKPGWYRQDGQHHYWDGTAWTHRVPAKGNQADWYPDPMGRHEYRYWNGSSWTQSVSDRGTQLTDSAPVRGTRPSSASQPSRGGWQKAVGWIGLAAIAISVIIGVAASNHSGANDTHTATADVPQSTLPTTPTTVDPLQAVQDQVNRNYLAWKGADLTEIVFVLGRIGDATDVPLANCFSYGSIAKRMENSFYGAPAAWLRLADDLRMVKERCVVDDFSGTAFYLNAVRSELAFLRSLDSAATGNH
jgi:hypothetical protein